MKPAVADYRTRVLCLRIVPTSGSTVRLTDHPRDLKIGSYTYLSTAGYEFTGFDATAGFSPAAIDIEGIADAAGISAAQIGSGLFDRARCYVFATSWAAPVEDQEPIVCGLFGRAELLDGRFRIGGVSLVDVLGQTIGDTCTPACPKKFGGTEYAGCGVALASYTVTGTLTAVSSSSVFTDSGRGEAADTYTAGTLQFTSGPNAGLRAIEVKSFSGGVITLWEPAYYLPAVGNTYTMTRGCRKRLSDCIAYGNVANFGGFPWVPTGSTYGKIGVGAG